ncbi:Poly A polymerase regulatory subunit, putative [Leishmania guyanensis]|uniref:Cap-specific mRNA (nucleoside-2'-O-)-methyltransferase n=1 Tax=Leishmania guyanensis TaxID=5670 RepID=A0A1E1J6E8_LEIGU|nr:hypothetical protein, conserved [Leishmania guyanensis]
MGSGYLKRKRKRQELLNDFYSALWSSSPGIAGDQFSKLVKRTVYHYPSSLPFPDLLDDDFPAEPYRSRNKDIKSAIHWGQRKLLLSEIQLLCMYCRPGVSYHIVYAGAAPGTHLAFLDEMFACRHTWELIDPGQFDRAVLEPRANFWLRNEFFTNATAYSINARRLTEVLPTLGFVYQHVAVESVQAEKKAIHEQLQGIVGTLDVARGTEDIPAMYEAPLSLPKGLVLLVQVALERNKPLLFISDIRSGSVALPNFEDHVAENMRAQECWTNILHGEHSMLKFRLPYTSKSTKYGGQGVVRETRLIREDGTVPYLRGDLLLPIWTRPTSTEGRLVVPQGAFQKDYNVTHVEDQFFFFNSRVREQVHFNHLVVHDDKLDHHYDAAAEVHCLLTYLRFMCPELKAAKTGDLRKEVLRVAHSITEHLGITFEDAARRRDALMINQAKRNQSKAVVDHKDDADGDEEAEDQEAKSAVFNMCAGSSESASVADTTAPEPRSEWELTMQRLVRLSTYDRNRPVWTRNVREEEHSKASGFWVTTKMPQS